MTWQAYLESKGISITDEMQEGEGNGTVTDQDNSSTGSDLPKGDQGIGATAVVDAINKLSTDMQELMRDKALQGEGYKEPPSFEDTIRDIYNEGGF